MTAVTISAHAKINLNLKILGRAFDGYHLLESVVQTVSLHDSLEIEVTPSGMALQVSDPSIPADETNLVCRAARRLCDLSSSGPRGLRIRLTKRIPAGAGLGGGSSDAAATLLALNRLWKLNLSAGSLAAAAAELGSDVPFFLTGGTALLSGRGTEVRPLPDCVDYLLLLVFPGLPVSTRAVYSQLEAPLTPTVKTGSMSRFVGARHGDVEAWVRLGNDLAPSARRLCSAIGEIEERMRFAGAAAVGVTGSGSAVFGIFKDSANLDRAAGALARPGWAVWRCSPLGHAEYARSVGLG